MYEGNIKQNKMIKETTLKHFNNIKGILESIGERVEGNLICDVSPSNLIIERNTDKIKNIQKLSIGKELICEIGFNAGHSLLLMLENNPMAEYVVFDLCNHKYTIPCLKYVAEQYPNTKIEFIAGDSIVSMPNYIKQNPNLKFDFIHVDGGHDLENVINDYNNSLLLIKDGGLILFDDYDYETIKEFINTKLDKGEIREYSNSELIKTPLHIVYTQC
jgi:predicted O-methyltransferase YrrM